ncbi:hypothetical protein MLD38_023513 [Melastoma candidum]|uniref:Uncharacterized protein n=1 Tax=Melastoma candidum TaxID=119954 RepID=A0ACB9NPN7_9MYRT|nr:hypothetical protein MLD38_023513 [Melastoma candidum]
MSTAPVKPPHHHHHQPQQQPPQQQRQHQHQQHQHQHQHQQPLHNFSLPSFLKWPSANGSGRVRRDPHPPRAPASPNRSNGVGRAEGDPNPKKEDLDGDGTVEGEDGRKPWNLRPRRGVVPTAVAAVGARNGEQEGGAGNRSRRNGDGGEHKKEEKEEGKKRRRLWIALTKEEIEEDVFIMTGCRPSRRPKKRNKTEQKQLDSVFPGLWLVGMTADAYRVAEAPAKR